MKIKGLKEVDIKSKWQAHFLQVFPINEVYDKLPYTHESDKEILKKYEEERPSTKIHGIK